MKKQIKRFVQLLFITCIILSGSFTISAQELAWRSYLTSKNKNKDMHSKVWNGRCTIDSAGNIFSSGYVIGDTLIVAAPASSDTLRLVGNTGVYSGYLIKYNQDGSIAWGKRMESLRNEVRDIVVDATGNVYITGSMYGNADFNPQGTGGFVSSFGGNDIYLAKYDNDGNFIWARGFGGNGADQGFRIGLDTVGNIYLTGTYNSETLHLNPGNTNGTLYKSAGPARNNIFIAKYDTAGNYKWGFDIGDRATTTQDGFTVSPSGDVIVSGYNASGSFTLGSGSNATVTALSGFVAKYNTDGILDWGYATGNSRIRGINITHDNYILFTGMFRGTMDMDYGPGTFLLVSQGGYDAFLSKYDSNGRCYGAAHIVNSSRSSYAENIVTDRVGNIYVSGRFTGTADFNPGPGQDTVTSSDRFDLFIAKYKPDWEFVWVRNAKGAGTEDGSGLAISNNGSVILAGFYEEDTTNNTGQNISPHPDLLATPSLALADGNAFVLQLSCDDTSGSYFTDTLECGAPYTLNNVVYTTAGTHIQRRANINGCDSTIILELIYTELNPEIIVDGFTLSTIDSYSSYQWLKNGRAIDGATTSQLVVDGTGDYQVVVTNQYGCTDTSYTYTTTTIPIAVNKVTVIGKQVKVYPNPAQDKLYIQSPVATKITLTGIDGRVLTRQENTSVIIMKDYAAGVYFLRINDLEGRLISVEKIVKK